MFLIEEINLKNKFVKILKPAILKGFEDKFDFFFTTKEICIKTKEENELEAVKANKEALLDYYKISKKNLFELQQTHSDNIKICNTGEKPCGISKKGVNYLLDTDAIILKGEDLAAILNFADCVPVALFDPVNCAIAGIHAGWRGTAAQITKKCLKKMVENFNTKPEKIIAVIGPCISQKGFETNYDVYEKLEKTVQNKDELFEFKNEKIYPDLAKINERQMIEEGVKTFCTSQFKTDLNNDLLYSYRKNNKTTNRISMVLKLKNCPNTAI